MADSAPKHLAEPPRRFGLSPLQQLFLVAMLSLAAISAVLALLTRDTGTGSRGTAGPATTRASAPTTASGVTSTTVPVARPVVRPTPGNLLADGDFERDLAGWTPLAGAEVERVQGGASGRWAAALSAGGPEGRAGMVRRAAATARAGTTYEATFWVRAPGGGGQVVLALRELAGGREVSGDQAGYIVDGGGWQQLAVEHHTRAPGSSLVLEIVGRDLAGDGRLLVDGVDLQTE
jgi:hypothetical protein